MTHRHLTLRTLALVAAAALLASCASIKPSEIPQDESYMVAVKTVQLPKHYAFMVNLAHHSFLDVKDGDEEHWKRIEFISFRGAKIRDIDAEYVRRDTRWSRDVEVLEVITGEDAQAAIERLKVLVPDYPNKMSYRTWPGPNSNTFIERMGREIPELSFVLHHNAVGKDYTEGILIGTTNSGTGVELELEALGVQLGLEEGIEVHLCALTFGLSLFPPALKLPFLPTLGF